MAAKPKAPIKRRNQKHIPVAQILAVNPNQPINSQQAAEHCQASTRTLADWRKKGLPHIAINARNFRYYARDIEHWLATRS